MTYLKTVFLGLTIGSLSAITACASPHSSASLKPTASAQDNGYLKPGADIRYAHTLKSQVSAGEITTFKLGLTESYGDGTLQVSLGTDGDISIVSADTQMSFDMASEASHDMNISILGNSNGRHYINVQALAVSPTGQTQPRIFSIPVQVGPLTVQKPDVNMKTMEDGETIIEMEAQEVIK